MTFASSRAMTAALVFASTVLSAQTANEAQAQEAVAAASCCAADDAFADQERDYYAFDAFDRNYGEPADRPACGADPVRRNLAARR